MNQEIKTWFIKFRHWLILPPSLKALSLFAFSSLPAFLDKSILAHSFNGCLSTGKIKPLSLALTFISEAPILYFQLYWTYQQDSHHYANSAGPRPIVSPSRPGPTLASGNVAFHSHAKQHPSLRHFMPQSLTSDYSLLLPQICYQVLLLLTPHETCMDLSLLLSRLPLP